MSIRCQLLVSCLLVLALPAAAQLSPPGPTPPVFDRQLAEELERRQRCLGAPVGSARHAANCDGAGVRPPPAEPGLRRPCPGGADADCDASPLRWCTHAGDFNCRQGVVPVPRRCLGPNDFACTR